MNITDKIAGVGTVLIEDVIFGKVLGFMNFEKQADLFKILSNPIRLRIIDILSKREASLEELTETIGIKKPNTSQHLAILKYLRIVKPRREGRRTLYKITNPQIKKLLELANGIKI